MEHPLIGDISGLTLDELSSRVSDLSKKLSQAQRTGNGHLCNQIRMALETFSNAYQTKLRETQKQEVAGVNFDKIINIE
jgi:hypothetical protein